MERASPKGGALSIFDSARLTRSGRRTSTKPHSYVCGGLLLTAALILGACDDPVVFPPKGILVGIVPDPVPALAPGDTVRLNALGRYASNITWTSSNTEVVTVSATGLVTAMSQGAAVVTATAVADPRAQDAALIQVLPATAPPLIFINSITASGSNAPVNPDHVVGLIDVTLHAYVPRPLLIERVETLIDGNVACSQSVPGGPSSLTGIDIVCSINTAAINPVTGARLYANGPRTVSGRLMASSAITLTSPVRTLIFNN